MVVVVERRPGERNKEEEKLDRGKFRRRKGFSPPGKHKAGMRKEDRWRLSEGHHAMAGMEGCVFRKWQVGHAP